MHVASTSRTVEEARAAITERGADVEDRAVALENAITHVCGRTALAVMGRADLMALAFSVDARMDTWLHAIGLNESDKLARAIYEESGILEDFRPHNT